MIFVDGPEFSDHSAKLFVQQKLGDQIPQGIRVRSVVGVVDGNHIRCCAFHTQIQSARLSFAPFSFRNVE